MQAPAPAQRHTPVLVNRCLDLLAPAFEAATAAGRTPIMVDATLGMGGHSEAALTRWPNLQLIGIDRDAQALAMASERLESFAARFTPVHAPYHHIQQACEAAGVPGVDGILFDLGVSSYQLDAPERGFAYSYDAPLDMRMDQSQPLTAAELVNTASEQTLKTVLQDYGQEKFAHRIVQAIIRQREVKPYERTGELVDTILQAYPKGTQSGHPAKRTFQAIRIAVNEELDILAEAMQQALDAVGLAGRVVVMSYHSLEDHIVKKAIRERTQTQAPPGLPVVPEELQPSYRMITRGTETPTAAEIEENPRAASAKLRAGERIRATDPTPRSTQR